MLYPYIHGGGRIGVLVVADTDVVNDEIKACLKNVAMQVAAMSPKYVSREEVSQEYMDHEKEILLAQAKKENPEKPENIIEKMIIGRLNKEMKEICLLDQVYVQDSDLTVAKYVDKVAKENGANVNSYRNSFVSRLVKESKRKLTTSQQKLQLRLECKRLAQARCI